MIVTVQALMMFSYFKLALANLLAFFLTNLSSPYDTTIFTLEDLSTSLRLSLAGKTTLCRLQKCLRVASMAEKEALAGYLGSHTRFNRRIPILTPGSSAQTSYAFIDLNREN